MKRIKWVLLVCSMLIGLSSVAQAANVMTTDSYSFLIGDLIGPYTDGHVPAPGTLGVAPGENIVVHVKDDGIGVDVNTIVMVVNGVQVVPNITGTVKDYTVTYNPNDDFISGETVFITVDAQDLYPN